MKENLLLKKILLKIFNRISADNNYLKIESIHFKNNYLRIEGNENSLQCEKQSFLRNSHVYIKGMENRISIDIETEVYGNNMQVLFVNGSNNQILIGKNCVIRDTTFFINGNNNVICLENNVSVYGAEFHIEQDNNCLNIKKGTTFHGRNGYPVHIALDEGSSITINEDCMFSNGIQIRSTDSHSIIDSTGKRINYAEDMMKAGTLFVLLTGGEPLLYPHFRELYQKLRELGMIITINTNGTLIDEAWADFFAENKPRRINITLYGASNETYERLCHYPGGFDKAVNGIRLLRERNIDVKVNGSLAKANVDDRMKIIELGESLDAPVRIDTYMYPSVRERNHAYNNQARLDPEMAAKARVEVLQREMGEEVFAQYRKIQLDEAENTPEGEAVPGQMACRAGKSSFVVNWQGEMRSCVVLDKPSIPLRDVEFEKAWELTKKGTESLRISARCSSCKLRKVCNTCVAAAIAETGKADGVPEYLCRYTEATVRYLKETSKK